MKDILKKSMFMGLGLAAMTKDKVQSVARQVAKTSKMSEDEGRKLADFLGEESRKARKELKETVKRMVGEASAKLPCGQRITELEARIATLEAQLTAQGEAVPEAAAKAPKAAPRKQASGRRARPAAGRKPAGDVPAQ